MIKSILTLFVSLVSFNLVAGDKVTSWDDLLKAQKTPENWITHHQSLDGQRFSGLDQINKKNVKDLRVAFTHVIGGLEGGGMWDHAGLEGTPIAEDGFLYVTDGWGSVYKFDVAANGKLVWKMNPETDHDFPGAVTCCGIDNRGVALWNDKVVSHTLDGRLIVTNKSTGAIEREVQLADAAVSEVITAAAFVVKDSAITGVSGAEYGIRGWLHSTDLNTGDKNWRTYTIPAPDEPGGDTWKQGPEEHSKNAYMHGGGSTWVIGSYDPELNVIYWGVGNPGPDWDNEYRPGDNLYSNSVLALDADSGAIKWYFQYTPNDPYDFDGVNEQTLNDANVFGKKTKAVLHADRNGFAYALDRVSGKFLWGTPFVKKLDWTAGLDKYTGRPMDYDANSDVQRYVAATNGYRAQPEGTSCPGNMGGKNWPPTAYDPNRNLYYIPVIESCAMHVNVPQTKEWAAREWWLGGAPKMGPIITGSVTAMDVNSGKVVAKYDMDYPNLSGVLATNGGLVFSATPDGRIFALDSDNLKELWSFSTNTANNAPPMTFAANGKQYVAILAGLGGAWPKWFVASTPGLETLEPGQQLFVFGL